jgi:hypothetical protein
MTQTALPLVKLYVANSYFYNCGMLLTSTIVLPADESDVSEKLREIQGEEENDYIVLRGETQFRCEIPQNFDILEVNKKLRKLTEKQIEDLKVISRLGSFSIMSILDQVLSGNYIIYDNVTSEEELGRRLYREGRLPFKIPIYLEDYIDFKKLGHEACVKNSIRIIPEMLAEKLCNAS